MAPWRSTRNLNTCVRLDPTTYFTRSRLTADDLHSKPVSLSSVVICFSLAFAFGGWARTAVSVGCRVVYAYLAYWLGIHKIKVKRLQGSERLNELERGIDFDLQRRELLRRISEINHVLGDRERGDQDRRSSWSIMGRGVNGRRRQRTTSFGL